MYKTMIEKHFCRCCLSEECYKDMENRYYIGNKTENYSEMLLTIFNINIVKDYAQRCLICEDCVSKLREAAAFKQKVLDVQETIKNKLDWDGNEINEGTKLDPKIEDVDYDEFDDIISDSFNDNDFLWENFNQGCSQNGQLFVIELNSQRKEKHKSKHMSKITKAKSIRIEHRIKKKGLKTLEKSSTVTTKEKETIKDEIDLEIHEEGDYNADTMDLENDEFESSKKTVPDVKETTSKKGVKRKASKGTQKKKTANKSKAKEQELSETELKAKNRRDNTLKLIQNSNMCVFKSLQNQFGCNYCKSKFPDFNQLREHSSIHLNTNIIELRINRLRGLSYRNAEISNLKCNLCSEICDTIENLMNHLKTEHEIPFHGTEHYLVPYNLKDGFCCMLCDSKFNSYLRLSIHMNSHYTNNVCEICGLSFINRLALRGHVHGQHTEKKCPQCPATFITNSSKIKHLRKEHNIHNSKRHCTLCKKTFRYTYLLEDHREKEHGIKKEVLHCSQCGRRFTSRVNLRTHIRSVHMRERNYPCSKCGIRFFTSCDRRRHERSHSDVLSFSCSYCEAKFKHKDSWKRHLKAQHGQAFGETMKLQILK